MRSTRFLLHKIAFGLLSLFGVCSGFANETVHSQLDSLWHHKFRVKALHQLDQMLAWAIPYSMRTYSIDPAVQGMQFDLGKQPVYVFAKEYGFFSKTCPLVGVVTEEKEDFWKVSQLLEEIAKESRSSLWVEVATAEVLTKLLAYRLLEKGMTFAIPTVMSEGRVVLVQYRVDAIFDLWQGMPAFGLAPVNSTAPSILLYRGTDFSLVSKRSWASILSDLDITGPGFKAFRNAQPEIHAWLQKMKNENHAARVMGFSLGGALAAYTLIYERALLAEKGSLAFNPPGISDAVLQEGKLPAAPRFAIFVSKGDFVPKLGKLIPYAYELSTSKEMCPIDAHVKMMSGEKRLYIQKIQLETENKTRL